LTSILNSQCCWSEVIVSNPWILNQFYFPWIWQKFFRNSKSLISVWFLFLWDWGKKTSFPTNFFIQWFLINFWFNLDFTIFHSKNLLKIKQRIQKHNFSVLHFFSGLLTVSISHKTISDPFISLNFLSKPLAIQSLDDVSR